MGAYKMYVISGIILVFVIVNYYLSFKLYQLPTNEKYYNNVNEIHFEKEKNILADPKYTNILSVLIGIMFGIYLALAFVTKMNPWVPVIFILVIMICFLIEISRTIKLREDALVLSKAFSKTKEINLRDIKGIYIYSFNKKFLKRHALTTKLVIATRDGKTYPFTLSSLNNKSVLNMMKENFGITEYKMFISKKINATVES